MKAKDLPKVTTLNLNKGKLLYSEDGVNLMMLPVSLMPIINQTITEDEEDEEDDL